MLLPNNIYSPYNYDSLSDFSRKYLKESKEGDFVTNNNGDFGIKTSNMEGGTNQFVVQKLVKKEGTQEIICEDTSTSFTEDFVFYRNGGNKIKWYCMNHRCYHTNSHGKIENRRYPISTKKRYELVSNKDIHESIYNDINKISENGIVQLDALSETVNNSEIINLSDDNMTSSARYESSDVKQLTNMKSSFKMENSSTILGYTYWKYIYALGATGDNQNEDWFYYKKPDTPANDNSNSKDYFRDIWLKMLNEYNKSTYGKNYTPNLCENCFDSLKQNRHLKQYANLFREYRANEIDGVLDKLH